MQILFLNTFIKVKLVQQTSLAKVEKDFIKNINQMLKTYNKL